MRSFSSFLQESYGGLLSSILINKLPQDFRLVITREMGDDDWQLDRLLTIFKTELEARERAAVGTTGNRIQSSPPKPNRKVHGTVHTLLSGSSTNGPTCTYCRGKHPSKDCGTVIDVLVCKDLLKKYGRCYVSSQGSYQSQLHI